MESGNGLELVGLVGGGGGVEFDIFKASMAVLGDSIDYSKAFGRISSMDNIGKSANFYG